MGKKLASVGNRAEGSPQHNFLSMNDKCDFKPGREKDWRPVQFMLSRIVMSRFFSPNIGFHGRLARGVIGALCLIAGIIMADFELWICLVLVALGLFGIFEAVRGWCLARACGIRTKL
jgi:hypothetical protein